MKTSLLIALLITSACSGPAANQDTKQTEPIEAQINTSEIRFPAAGTDVAGTLVDAGSETPTIIFVAGSGPTDRNWESPLLPGDNGSARLLAAELAERGISSLRYDKRGTGGTELPPRPLQWSDYLAEVEAAIQFVKTSPRLGRSDVYLLGHSEGAAHVLRYVTTQSEQIVGVILVNGAGRPLGDVIVSQIDGQLKTAGVNDTDRSLHRGILSRAIQSLAAGNEIDPVAASPYPGVQSLVKILMAENARPFSNDILLWKPTDSIKSYHGKTLILQGDRDVQIDVELDAQVLKNAQPKAQLIIIGGGDHVMKFIDKPREEMTSQDGLIYNSAGRTLAPGFVDAISDFVKKG